MNSEVHVVMSLRMYTLMPELLEIIKSSILCVVFLKHLGEYDHLC